MTEEIVLVSAVRTPVGAFQGALASVPAPRLGALVIEEALKRAGVQKDQVDEVIMGNVLAAGEGQAPARRLNSLRICVFSTSCTASTSTFISASMTRFAIFAVFAAGCALISDP